METDIVIGYNNNISLLDIIEIPVSFGNTS
jgi:hypothetical protein